MQKMQNDASKLKQAIQEDVALSKNLTTDPSAIESTESQLSTNEGSISSAKTDLEAQATTEAKSFTADEKAKVALAEDNFKKEQAEQTEKDAELKNEKTGGEPTGEGEEIHFEVR